MKNIASSSRARCVSSIEAVATAAHCVKTFLDLAPVGAKYTINPSHQTKLSQ